MLLGSRVLDVWQLRLAPEYLQRLLRARLAINAIDAFACRAKTVQPHRTDVLCAASFSRIRRNDAHCVDHAATKYYLQLVLSTISNRSAQGGVGPNTAREID